MTGLRIGVVGAGIVGLAVARRMLEVRPDVSVTVLEKEMEVATHQTGHNSGVVHSGVYYAPGSLKARLCTHGVRLLRTYCSERGVPYHEVGKLIVAVKDAELPRLHDLLERGRRNGVPGIAWCSPTAMKEIEPHVGGLAALHLPQTAIVDYRQVAKTLAVDIATSGGSVQLGARVIRIEERHGATTVETSAGDFGFDLLITCAGLHSDRVARLTGDGRSPMIIPFRGEYGLLRQDRAHLVKGLIYPVPDPRYPFLGIHLTRHLNGTVTLGPNAVLSLSREGYRRRDLTWRDIGEMARWPGLWRLAAGNWRTALHEVSGSISRRRFVALARPYLPELRVPDVVVSPPGVRAQAVDVGGGLVDDFVITRAGRAVNVRNAPSPAATAGLAIAEYVVEQALAGED